MLGYLELDIMFFAPDAIGPLVADVIYQRVVVPITVLLTKSAQDFGLSEF